MGVRLREHLLPFTRIGAYRVEGLLSRGATASVYLCRHLIGGHLGALKLLHPHLARDDVAEARFVREARVLSRVVHPNVVNVIDLGDHEGVPYFVTDFVEGNDLADYIRGGLSLRQIFECMLPVIDAVAAIHAAGVVHRDLKPSNIRIASNHRGGVVPKVLDLGSSKLDDDLATRSLTESGAALGTLGYMSPEQLLSSKDVDARSDVYALGVILYECATGTQPFHGKSAYDLMHAILTIRVAPPSFLRPHLSAQFERVVMRAIARDRGARFASARELCSALGACALHLADAGARVIGHHARNQNRRLQPSSPPEDTSTMRPSEGTLRSADSPPRASRPLERARLLACSHSARRDELKSLLERVQSAPESGSVKGMYVMGLLQTLRNSGVDCAIGRRIQSFQDFPLRGYMELLLDTATTLYPNMPMKEGLYRLGQLAIPTFATSMIGRVLMSMGGGIWEDTLDYLSRGYQVSLSGGKATVVKRGHGSALVQLRGIWTFGESYQIGLIDGLMAACRVRGTITPQTIAAEDVDLKVEWEPKPPTGD